MNESLSTHAMEATNCHQNSKVINQLNRHMRQPPPHPLERRGSSHGPIEPKACQAKWKCGGPHRVSPGVGDEHLYEEHWCSCEHL
jgi:hypothetical protein